MSRPAPHVLPQAIGPLRERLIWLRTQAAAELDPDARDRMLRAAQHLEILLHQLEHGHAPT